MHFMAEKKSRKRSGFVIHSYFKDSTFSAVKRVAKLYTRVSIEVIRKGYLFCQKGI